MPDLKLWVQDIEKFAQYGDAAKVKALAGKSEISFDDFVDAFHKVGKTVEGEGNCIGWAARDSSGKLSPMKFNRREPRADDVVIQIAYAGMCHSDVHTIRAEWGQPDYPVIPGHEMIGVVTEVGDAVKKFKAGDFVGVGCMVDSCGDCSRCKKDAEQYCEKGMVPTYGGKYASAFQVWPQLTDSRYAHTPSRSISEM